MIRQYSILSHHRLTHALTKKRAHQQTHELRRVNFGFSMVRNFNSASREAVPFTPKKVLIVSKVTLLNYESRKAYRKPWDRLSIAEKQDLSKHLEREGFHMQELIDSHGMRARKLSRNQDYFHEHFVIEFLTFSELFG